MNKAKIELFNFMLKEAEKLGVSSDLLCIMTKALIMDEKGSQEEGPRDPTAEMWDESEDEEEEQESEECEECDSKGPCDCPCDDCGKIRQCKNNNLRQTIRNQTDEIIRLNGEVGSLEAHRNRLDELCQKLIGVRDALQSEVVESERKNLRWYGLGYFPAKGQFILVKTYYDIYIGRSEGDFIRITNLMGEVRKVTFLGSASEYLEWAYIPDMGGKKFNTTK